MYFILWQFHMMQNLTIIVTPLSFLFLQFSVCLFFPSSPLFSCLSSVTHCEQPLMVGSSSACWWCFPSSSPAWRTVDVFSCVQSAQLLWVDECSCHVVSRVRQHFQHSSSCRTVFHRVPEPWRESYWPSTVVFAQSLTSYGSLHCKEASLTKAVREAVLYDYKHKYLERGMHQVPLIKPQAGIGS